MPRLSTNDDMQQHNLGGGFSFSAVKVDNEHLGATSYTLVTVMLDTTGSVVDFADEIRRMLVTAVEACKKSPQSDNLLLRACTFDSVRGVQELHGFKELALVDTARDYPDLSPAGMTPLFDAVYSAVGATNKYAELLRKKEYGCNSIMFVVTDGCDNNSTVALATIKDELARAVSEERLESQVSILVGINAASYKSYLTSFQTDAGITQYVDAGSATPANLAKLAAFVSRSISSQSQALGTGGPSQGIQATI